MICTVRRISIKSVVRVAFVCILIAMLPTLPVFLFVFAMPPAGYGAEPPGVNFVTLLGALAIPLMYGVFAAIVAAIVALAYNLSVRFHGGIKFDIELQEVVVEEKRKN